MFFCIGYELATCYLVAILSLTFGFKVKQIKSKVN